MASWQAKGARGGSWNPRGGGFGGGSFGPGFTAFGQRMAIVLGVAYALTLFIFFWLRAPGVIAELSLWPWGSGEVGVWQLVTHPFVEMDGWSFLGTLLVLFFFEPHVERYLGQGRLITFLLATTVLPGLVYIAVGGFVGGGAIAPYSGVEGPIVAMVCAFAWLNPNAQILLMFILPVRAIYIAYLTIGIEVVGFLTRQPWSIYHLAAIGVAYAVVEKGVRLPDLRYEWLKRREKRIKKKLKKFEVIRGGRDDQNQMLH